ALAVAPRAADARAGAGWLNIGEEAGLVPRQAIRFAAEHDLRDHMYNDMEVGSYLTWEGWPRHRVFQDPRINGYPPAFHALLRRDDLSHAEWDALLAGFGVSTALVTYPAENPRAAFFDPERWALVYRADDGLVFVRRRPEVAALIARAAGSPVSDCEWQRRLADFFTETQDDRRALATFETARATRGCVDDV